MSRLRQTVIVGMSGGVDSSVGAYLLKEQGYNVIGVFMRNWDEKDEFGECLASKDYKDVVSVCEKLEIEYHSVEFIDEYKELVFDKFVKDYRDGLTPNPDVLCNKEIKFKYFYDKALELGADFIATGHYCRKFEIDGEFYLAKGIDGSKDQSYFLSEINGDVLKKVLFPLGDMKKTQIRKIARELKLSVKDKKDSTGICFIGERKFKEFLSQYIKIKPGDFKSLDGEIVGQHSGSYFYTLGQRKGLGLGGPGDPWYVVDKNMLENIVYVERGDNHPALFVDTIEGENLHLINQDFAISFPFKCYAKIRYRQEDQACTIHKNKDETIKIEFDYPQKSATPGQFIVFYQDQICIGGVKIVKLGKSYFEMKKKLPVTV